MKKEYIASSSVQTKKLGGKLAKKILEKRPACSAGRRSGPRSTAFIIGLEGELGGGKTAFLQGFAKGLGIKEKILSPTFVICKKFQIPNYKLQTGSKSQISKFQNFFHFDCYRTQKPKEILGLGFKEIISNPKNIIAVEWAEKIKKIMPKNTVWVKFKFLDKKRRRVSVDT